MISLCVVDIRVDSRTQNLRVLLWKGKNGFPVHVYRVTKYFVLLLTVKVQGADKSLARPTSRCMNIKASVAVACFFPGRDKDLSAPLYLGLHVECPTFLSDFNQIWSF